MMMPGRKYVAGSRYRYGFNGKENDVETNTQDYGFRDYYSNIGRLISIDPLTKNFPQLTPYQFASNRPIDGIDQLGLQYYKANDCRIMFAGVSYDEKTKSITQAVTFYRVENIPNGLKELLHNNATNCENCIYAENWYTSTGIVGSINVTWEPESPAMSDVKNQPSMLQPQESGQIVNPGNNKERRQMIKNKEFYKPWAAGEVADAKLGRALVVIDLTGKLASAALDQYVKM